MTDPLLSKRRVDPEKVDRLRAHFEALSEDRDLVERSLEIENVVTEAAFLREDADGPVLYYYMERGDEYPPDLDPEELPDAVLELGTEHEKVLDDVCLESPRNADGDLESFETLFYASTLDGRE